jgi:hypothetical protein
MDKGYATKKPAPKKKAQALPIKELRQFSYCDTESVMVAEPVA